MVTCVSFQPAYYRLELPVIWVVFDPNTLLFYPIKTIVLNENVFLILTFTVILTCYSTVKILTVVISAKSNDYIIPQLLLGVVTSNNSVKFSI